MDDGHLSERQRFCCCRFELVDAWTVDCGEFHQASLSLTMGRPALVQSCCVVYKELTGERKRETRRGGRTAVPGSGSRGLLALTTGRSLAPVETFLTPRQGKGLPSTSTCLRVAIALFDCQGFRCLPFLGHGRRAPCPLRDKYSEL